MQHWVRFYFPFTFELEQRTRLEQVYNNLQTIGLEQWAVDAGLPLASSDKGSSSGSVWTQETIHFDSRFDPHVDTIVNGRQGAARNQKPLRLCPDARNSLNGGGPGNPGEGFGIKLPKSSMLRLKAKDIMPPKDGQAWIVSVQDMLVHFFDSGVGVVVLELGYQAPGKRRQFTVQSPQEVLELNYHLARNQGNKQTPGLSWAGHEMEPVQGLGELIDRTLPFIARDACFTKKHWSNAFCYSVVETEGEHSKNELETLSYRLARKNTDAYLPEQMPQWPYKVRHFQPICHQLAYEGCATVIHVTPDASDAIKNFRQTACRQAYEPMVLLAFVESLFLNDMTQGANTVINLDAPTDDDFALLKSFRTRLYNFRLNNRFSLISGLTQHNQYYQALREVFTLDKQLAELNMDVQEVEAFIGRHLAEKKQQSLDNLKILGSLFASLVLLADLSGVNIKDVFYSSPPLPTTMVVLFWGVLGIIVLGFGWYFLKRKP